MMGGTIQVVSRRRSREAVEREWPGCYIADVTSKGEEPWVKFSPFYPHGGIPVPFWPDMEAESVEGIWQGLKVFESAGVDPSKFRVTSMKGIKRSVRKHGRVRGHQKGADAATLLSYQEARYAIYLPCYRHVLEHCLEAELDLLREKAGAGEGLVLLDYETNCEVRELAKPLSHASLVRAYLMDAWPER